MKRRNGEFKEIIKDRQIKIRKDKKNKHLLDAKVNSQCKCIGPSISVMFFYLTLFQFLPIQFTQSKESNLSIFTLKFICKDKTVNYIEMHE